MWTDLAWPEVERSQRADQLATLGRVLFREQTLRGNLCEFRVSVVGVTVGIGQLQGLNQRVQVLGRVPTHGAEIASLHDVQSFDQRRPLAPETGLIDLTSLKCG